MWSEPRRAHPAGILLYAMRYAGAFAAPIIGVLVIYDLGLDDPGAIVGIALISAAVILGVIALALLSWLQWRRFTFRIDDGALRVEQGLLIRRSTRLTSERIQSVDTKANLVFRVLGLVTVDIHTAGKGQEPEVSIPALAEDEARELVHALRSRGVAAADGVEAEGAAAGAESSTATGPAWRLTGREMFIVATTSNAGILALAALAPVAAALVPLLPQAYIERLTAAPGSWIVIGFVSIFTLFMLVFAWVAGSVATLLQFWEFSTTRVDGEVRVEQGLLQRNTRNVPLDRVQAVRLVEGPLRQAIGRVTVGVDSAGIATGSQLGPTVIHPLLTRADARRFCDLMVPGHTPPPLLPPPERARRRYLVRATLLPALVAIVVAIVVPFGWLAIVLPAGPVLWGLLAFSDAAWGIGGDVLAIRWRGFGRSTAFVRRRRIQSVAVSQHPLQTRAGLATLSVRVAASPATAVFTIRHLDVSDAMRVLEWVSEGVELAEETL